MKKAVVALLFVLSVVIAGCGRSQQTPGEATSEQASSQLDLPTTTPAPKGKAGTVTWAVYRPVETLDPIQAFDYPDNTAISAMCESVLRQSPDGTIGPGLATAHFQSPTKLLLTVRAGAEFWDGHPVTAADVAWSLERNTDPSLGGFYGAGFEAVKAFTVTGPRTLLITLREPDYSLEGELSSTPSVVMEKTYSERQGQALGTPSGGIMCTGAYKLQGWNGEVLTMAANPSYWGPEKPMSSKIEIRGVPDEATLTAGLQTGEISGTYPAQLGTINQLEESSEVSVYEGPSYATVAFVVSSLEGALKDVRVRQALSMAIDRKAYVSEAFKGHAVLPRTLANPGTWGYARRVFEQDWNSLPEEAYDVAKGKQLVKEAGASGDTIVIGTSGEIPSVATAANAVRAAGEAVGLKVKFKSVSAAQYIGFFTDPKQREGVDGFPTVNYPNYADPANFYASFALPESDQNYSGFSDSAVTKDLAMARATADPDRRAELVAKAGDRLMQDLPWIPLAQPTTQLVLNKKLSGAPSSFVFMFGPWANGIGSAG